jgi:hypothetical protein
MIYKPHYSKKHCWDQMGWLGRALLLLLVVHPYMEDGRWNSHINLWHPLAWVVLALDIPLAILMYGITEFSLKEHLNTRQMAGQERGWFIDAPWNVRT